MQNNITLHLRAFPVTVKDNRDGHTYEQLLVLDKSQLQAAQAVGQSSTNLIERIFNRQGFKVLEIDTPRKYPLTVDLTALYKEAVGVQD